MKITIEDQTYMTHGFTIQQAMRAAEVQLALANAEGIPNEAEKLGEALEFIANDLFQGKFTPDDLMNRYRSDTVFADIHAMLAAPRNLIDQKLATFPTPPEADEKNVHTGSKKK